MFSSAVSSLEGGGECIIVAKVFTAHFFIFYFLLFFSESKELSYRGFVSQPTVRTKWGGFRNVSGNFLKVISFAWQPLGQGGSDA